MSNYPADAPTPDSLEAAIDALDEPSGFAGDTPEAAPPSQPAEQATPQDRDAAPTNAEEPPAEEIDYPAEVARLQKMIDNREWSSQGRLRQAEKRIEAYEARIKELETGYQSEDDYRAGLFNDAINEAKKTGNTELERTLTERRDFEIQQRQFNRQRQAEAAQQQAVAAERQGGEEVVRQYHERTIRTEALPELGREVDRIAKQYDLPEHEVAAMRAIIDTPANQMLVKTAPPKYIGAWSLAQLEGLEAFAQAAQARVVAANREAAGTVYRGAVDSASAGKQAPTLAQFSGSDDLLGAYDALYPDS